MLLLFEWRDWILLSLGLLGTILWSLFLFFCLLKPKLQIDLLRFDNDFIKISVSNSGKSNIVNIKIEACVVECLLENSTYHFHFLENEFLLLPPRDKKNIENTRHERVFQIDRYSNQAITNLPVLQNESLIARLQNKNSCLRIRVHASHENSGFGKAFEIKYKYIGDKFSLIKKI